MKQTVFICLGCGKDVKYEDARGSYKEPYCKKCYDKIKLRSGCDDGK